MKVVKLAYYDEFHCIGSDCKDSCCKYWKICLFKNEYLYYQKMDCSPKLRSVIDTAFRQLRENEIYYAEMRLRENGDCPFLDNDSLCMIQKESGEDALSYTCNTFPRQNGRVGENTIRQYCTATCCHVTELLMNHPEGLAVVEEEYDGKNKYINNGLFNSPAITKQWTGFAFYWQLLNAQIDILQNRAFSIAERMLILGYFCQKADEYINNNTPYKIPSLANMLLDKELCKKIADSLRPSQSDDSAAVKSMNILIMMNSRAQIFSSAHPKKLFSQVMDRLDCTFEEKDAQTAVNFSAAEYKKLCKVFRQIENERTYIIENLLVNLVFSNDPQQGVWNNYFILAVFYNTLKICAPVFLSENYDDKELAAALTYAVKMVINTHLAEKGTLNDFVEKHTHTLPYAAFLIC